MPQEGPGFGIHRGKCAAAFAEERESTGRRKEARVAPAEQRILPLRRTRLRVYCLDKALSPSLADAAHHHAAPEALPYFVGLRIRAYCAAAIAGACDVDLL